VRHAFTYARARVVDLLETPRLAERADRISRRDAFATLRGLRADRAVLERVGALGSSRHLSHERTDHDARKSCHQTHPFESHDTTIRCTSEATVRPTAPVCPRPAKRGEGKGEGPALPIRLRR
jgi:hypothetical protein